MEFKFSNPRDERCQSDGWAFIGIVQDKKGPERQVPIGVWKEYADGRVQANAWMKSTANAIRWEAQQVYEPVRGED